MEKIIKFKTSDGTLFDSKAEAQDHERLITYTNMALGAIKIQEGEVETGIPNTKFGLALFDVHFKHMLALVSKELFKAYLDNPRGIIGRYLSDSTTPAGQLLNRVYYIGVLCVGKDGKSYSQPYFADKTWE